MTLVFASKGDQPKWVPLYDAARTADPGELITYDRLVEILGEDIRDTNRYPIDAARKHLERDSHRTLVAVPNEGYRVSQAEEHAGLARWHQRKSRRQIKKALSKTISADRSQLARDQLTLLDALELHLQRQAEFLRRTAERVAIVETVQTDQIEKSTAHEERIRVLERRLARFLAEE